MRLKVLGSLITVIVVALAAPLRPALTQDPPSSTPMPFPSVSATTEPQSLAACRRRQRTEAEYHDIVQPWIDALWSFYATGDGDLGSLSTAQGLEQLRVFDWRFRAVESDGIRFREVPELVDFNLRVELCSEPKRLVRLVLEPIIDVAPGAQTYDAGLEVVLEEAEGRQRRSVALGFVRSPGREGWLVDEVGPADPVPGFVQPATARPCPDLKDPRRAADPWLMKPWCAANGDGRWVPGLFARGREVDVGGQLCDWKATHFILMGLPPGTPYGFANFHQYVRDPQGTVPGLHGFRRDVRPPKDAISSGITNGYATLWTSKKLGDEWLLVQVGDPFERWPASDAGCTGN